MALVNVNGIKYFFDADNVEISKVSNGRWNVRYDDRSFIVVGGIHSGGARNEWFCYHPEFYGENWIPCKSMIAAIRTGIAY